MTAKQGLKRVNGAAAIASVVMVCGTADGADLNLAQKPLFLSTTKVEPNVLFILDSSRSMDWGLITPETHPTNVARGAIMRIETDLNGWDYFYPTYAADNEQNAQDGVVPTQEAANSTAAASYMAGVWRARNSNYNKMYYDPTQSYEPWAGVDSVGNAYTDASPTAARQDPFNPTPTINLTVNTSFTTQRPCLSSESCSTTSLAVSYMPARYWVWEDTNAITPANAGNGLVDPDDRHALVQIIPNNQCTGSQTPIKDGCYTRTYTEELQNFANWWVYHRRREYAMKYAVSRVISSGNGVRMGISTIHTASLERQIESMNPSVATGNKKGLLDTLFSINCDSGGTPLRSALDEAGKYFQCSGTTLFGGTHCPVETTVVSPATEPAGGCQQNFAILVTDGYYSSSFTASANDDADSSSYTDGGTTYRFDGAPYADSYTHSLADIAMHYYERDLHSGLANKVPMTCGVDENPGQHMVTYTVGFGVKTVLDPTTLPPHPKRGYAANCPAETGTALSWPDPGPSSGRIDDLMHAAYNGRGEYFSATQSDELANALIAAVGNISQRTTASAAGIDFNSGSVRAGSQAYQARFESDEWTGQVLALGLHDGSGNNGCSVSEPLGTVCPIPEWDAGCTLTGGSCASTGSTIASPNLGTARQIVTFNTTTRTGVPLQWGDLSAAQQSALGLDEADQADANGAARLGYLRGDRTNEVGNGGIFRDRTSVLGDIIHSSPLYVDVPKRRYPSAWSDNLGGSTPENGASAQTYSSFRTDYQRRTTMVYSGSNDGMLHGFESGTFDNSGNLVAGTNKGKELVAYMPSTALASARHLTYPSYTHRYYVDGPPVENDVFFEADDSWHTVLAGGLASGGQGLYALDITNPSDSSASAPVFDEANASQLVLWEFTDEGDPDLGYTLSKPAIVRLHNGDWGIVVGNGYNNTEADGAASATGNAVFYVLDIENGNVLAKLDTGVGSAQDPTGQSRPNGMASVFPVDKDGDFITDYVYGGDLFGNVWRFDLTGTSASNWTVSAFGTGSPKPLFTAVDGSGNPQSITTKVQVAAHPNGVGHGVMVYFGTGKYLEVGDAAANTSTIQTFYGIWDKDFFGVGTSIDVIGALASVKKSGFTRAGDLQQQQIDAVATVSGEKFRRVTNNSVDYTAPKHGWYLDLKLSTGSSEGEMVIADPIVRGEGVIFTTFIPSSDVCNAGNTGGFLMVLNRATGGRLTKSPFDVNDDGTFSVADYLLFGDSGSESAAGIDVGSGKPGIIFSGGKDLALIPKLDGTIEGEVVNLGLPKAGRKTWVQLR